MLCATTGGRWTLQDANVIKADEKSLDVQHNEDTSVILRLA